MNQQNNNIHYKFEHTKDSDAINSIECVNSKYLFENHIHYTNEFNYNDNCKMTFHDDFEHCEYNLYD